MKQKWEELWGVSIGLEIGWPMRYKKLSLESYSLEIVAPLNTIHGFIMQAYGNRILAMIAHLV
ncbi:hypothetical protein Lal_00038208 [Lupinus albus]|nr:hypothetical protein Lal_00038208 [Lupinus albus]